MSKVKKLTLADDREPWARQAGETAKAFSQFQTYLELGRGNARTLTRAAEALTLSYGYLRQVSAAHLWTARANAYDEHHLKIAEAEWREERRQALMDDAKILRAATGKIATELHRLGPLSESGFLRLLDIVLRHRRVLYGDPTQVISLEAGGGEAGQDMASGVADVFARLSPENRRAQLIDLAERLRMRQEAAESGE